MAVLFSTPLLAFLVNWSWGWAIAGLLMFYLFCNGGVNMMMHRFWSHKTFEFSNPIVEWIFTAVAVLAGRGSPLGWVYVHRLHHAHADTEKDPHSPEYGFRFFSIKGTTVANKLDKLFLVRDMLTKKHLFLNDYYFGFLAVWALFLLCFGLNAFFFLWLLPICLNQLTQDFFTYFTHVNTGYRNFEVKDNSKNVLWLWPVIWGDSLHNNHHGNAAMQHYAVKKWEFDPLFHIIKFFRK